MTLSRRSFLRTSLLATPALRLAPLLSAEEPLTFRLSHADTTSTLHLQRGAKTLNSIELPPTAHLLVHPHLPVVYAFHRSQAWDNARSAVRSIHYNPQSGQLRLNNTTPLSLGAITLADAAITHPNNALYVLTRQGISNLFHLEKDGSPSHLLYVHKQLALHRDASATVSRADSIQLDLHHDGHLQAIKLARGSYFDANRPV